MLLFGVCGEDKEGRGMSGDLISKQALSKEIKEKIIPDKYGTSNAVLDVMGAVLRVIGEQVTAYDVEEVIQQLEELISSYESCVQTCIKEVDKKYQVVSTFEICSLHNNRGYLDGLKAALEIVKSGGIEQE